MAMTRAELNQAFREVASMEFADVPCNEEQIQFTFSDNFIKKMDKLIERQKKPYWEYVNTAKKRVAVVVIVFLFLFVTVFGFEEVRASMLQWCADVYNEYIYYYFEGETTKEIEHEYRLTMVPEGFEVVVDMRDSQNITICYENAEGDYIQFYQNTTEGYDYFVDNENGEWSTDIINNNEVKLFDYTSALGALWVEDGYAMFLCYYGCEDIEIIKEMVKTIE